MIDIAMMMEKPLCTVAPRVAGLAVATLCTLIIGACAPPIPGPPNLNFNVNVNDAGVDGNDNLGTNDNGTDNVNENGATGTEAPAWGSAFDASTVGFLSSVWGTGPDDVFVVGGLEDQGEGYHFDGTDWRKMKLPIVPLLVWVFGFAPDDVWAVGLDGGVVHYDGADWTRIATGTSEDLWGIWGASSDDLWIVGGDVGTGAPLLMHFDGDTAFTPVDLAESDRLPTSLFKVWGIGSSIFAVGENGYIVQLVDGEWVEVLAGPNANDDFVSLWGTSEDNIVAVGGRISGRIAVYDGTKWTTEILATTPGLNAVFMDDPERAIVGGINGYVGAFDPTTMALSDEESGATRTVHAIWGDGAGRYYAVGGDTAPSFTGLALVRSTDEIPADPPPPLAIACGVDDDCAVGEACGTDGLCEAAAQPQCTSDTDCDNGQVCVEGSCGASTSPTCSTDTDCDDGLVCIDGICQEAPAVTCATSDECMLGEICTMVGTCAADTSPQMEIGFLEGGEGGVYRVIGEGDEMPLFPGFQGLADIFVTIHATGFGAPGTIANLDHRISIALEGIPCVREADCGALQACIADECRRVIGDFDDEFELQATDVNGVLEIPERGITVNDSALALDGLEVLLE
ncbi:MAG: hypothetical protein IID36_13245, partial [Planctomycetes bacterium]|nr:hypothetical protein [Planctomycetota bacterium]